MNTIILVEQYVSFLVVRDLPVTLGVLGSNIIIDERQGIGGDV